MSEEDHYGGLPEGKIGGLRDRVRSQLGSILSWQGESPRVIWLFALGLALGLIVLFRSFIFSDDMLNSNDILGFGLSHRQLFIEHFKATGTFPSWNPSMMCGIPYVEAIHGGVFYLLSVIDYLGYIPRMIGFNFLIHFLLSGIFTYLAARQLRLTPVASIVAGTAYAFSPLMISWVAPGHDGKIFSATLFPLVVLFCDRIWEHGTLRDALGLAVALGMSILTPHLQMAYYTGLFLAAHSIFKLLGLVRKHSAATLLGKRSALFGTGIILALTLSAIQWVPSLSYIPNQSPRLDTRSQRFAAAFSLHPEEALAIPIPEFCGLDRLPEERTYWGRNSLKDNSESVGPVTFALALLGLLLPGRKQRFWWGAVATGVLIYALGSHSPFFASLVSYLPLANAMRAPSTSMYIFLFATVILAGMGVQNIATLAENGSQASARWLRISLTAVPTLLFILAVLMTLKGRGFLTYYAAFVYPDLLQESAQWKARWEHALANLPYLKIGLWSAWLFVTLTAASIYLYLKKKGMPIIFVLVAILIFVSNGEFTHRFVRLLDAHAVFDPNPVAQFLRSHAGYNRVAAADLNQNKYQVGWYPIQTTFGYHGKEPVWYYRLFGESGGKHYFTKRCANLAGTRFVVFPRAETLATDTLGPIRFDTAFAWDDCMVFENHNAFPRAYLVESVQVYDSLNQVQRETVSGTTDLRRVVLLEEMPTLPLEKTDDTSAVAEIVSYDTDSVIVNVKTATNRMLILTDNWFEAWDAYVDCVEKKIYRAYGSFRAVEVQAGSKQVVFKYHSTYVHWGGILSLLGLGIVATLISAPWVRSAWKRFFSKQKPPLFRGGL